jgi:hypothetical protein
LPEVAVRSHLLVAMLVGAMLLPNARYADRDRFVTGSALGVGSGRSTGGLADYGLIGMLPGGLMVGTSGCCYQWTRSGRLIRAACR